MKLYVKKKYGVVPNELLNNPAISLRAKGLFAYLQSKPSEWRFSIKRISQQTREGKDAIRNALKELEKSGYLQRIPARNERGKWSGYDYVLAEKPLAENPTTEKPSTENPDTLSKKDSSKKEVVKKIENINRRSQKPKTKNLKEKIRYNEKEGGYLLKSRKVSTQNEKGYLLKSRNIYSSTNDSSISIKEDISDFEKQILEKLQRIKIYPYQQEKDLQLIREIWERRQVSEAEMLDTVDNFAIYCEGPYKKKKNKNPRLTLKNFFRDFPFRKEKKKGGFYDVTGKPIQF